MSAAKGKGTRLLLDEVDKPRIVKLVSRLNHPVRIGYDGTRTVVIAPRGSTQPDLEENKLGSIPQGVVKIIVGFK